MEGIWCSKIIRTLHCLVRCSKQFHMSSGPWVARFICSDRVKLRKTRRLGWGWGFPSFFSGPKKVNICYEIRSFCRRQNWANVGELSQESISLREKSLRVFLYDLGQWGRRKPTYVWALSLPRRDLHVEWIRQMNYQKTMYYLLVLYKKIDVQRSHTLCFLAKNGNKLK